LATLPRHLTPALSLIFRHGVVDSAALEVGMGWADTEVRAAMHALEVAGVVQRRTRTDAEPGWSLALHACEAVNLHLMEDGLGAANGRSE
jgi:transcription initiation factor IIE alpha subunit